MTYIAAALVIANVLVWVRRLLLDASKGIESSIEAMTIPAVWAHGRGKPAR
jgi:hypothetical protein